MVPSRAAGASGMTIATACTVHIGNPDPLCIDCEDQFCADCGQELTARNSGPGMDICDDCETKREDE
jgi:hypothetical protein